ncbi:mitogen-activated protein kinase-binding protein 1-like [Stigmatopora nigra]
MKWVFLCICCDRVDRLVDDWWIEMLCEGREISKVFTPDMLEKWPAVDKAQNGNMVKREDAAGSFRVVKSDFAVAAAAAAKSRQGSRKTSKRRVALEKVLGVSTSSSSALASDPNSGLVAYLAGCVVVLLHPQLKTQRHVVNASRKAFSALAFSGDGKHLVTGESGHLPRVRVWPSDGGVETASVQKHKCAVSCVAFSPDGAYVVSVGSAYDMTVCVWDWKKGSVLASNKVSSGVSAVSFSEDGGYFVTAGKRHVKFWYLDASRERQVNGTVPLMGRPALLGERQEAVLVGVACGRGPSAPFTYAVTESGLLCRFDAERRLEAWVSLEAACACSVAAGADYVFCGCSDGVVRVFEPVDLRYVATLPRPPRLGASPGGPPDGERRGPYPDAVALSFDPALRHLTCVFSDRSLYVWDVSRPRVAVAVHSAVYHGASVWSLQVCPSPSSSFLTCSSDGTVRQWRPELCGEDLLRTFSGEDGCRTELRVLALSPDGRRLATGDRRGTLRIYDWESPERPVKMEAHDSEILAVDFSPAWTGGRLLASAGRDRLVRVFRADADDYRPEQTLSDHSAAVLGVKFVGGGTRLRLVSCGADKSIYFYTCRRNGRALSLERTHHLVEKTALHHMDLVAPGTRVAIACQDRTVRLYHAMTGKLSKCLRGLEGAPLKVAVDPSGWLLAVGCSDKKVYILDLRSGERLATLTGHSEPVSCLSFSVDARFLASASGDGCVAVWRLEPSDDVDEERPGEKSALIRRETFVLKPAQRTPSGPVSRAGRDPGARPWEEAPSVRTNGKMPAWFRKLNGQPAVSTFVPTEMTPLPNRWLENSPLVALPSPAESQDDEDEDFLPRRLDRVLGEGGESDREAERQSQSDETSRRAAEANRWTAGAAFFLPDDVGEDAAGTVPSAEGACQHLLPQPPPLAVCRRFLARYGHRLRKGASRGVDRESGRAPSPPSPADDRLPAAGRRQRRQRRSSSPLVLCPVE